MKNYLVGGFADTPGRLPLDGRWRRRRCGVCGKWVVAAAEVGLLIMADSEPATRGQAAKALVTRREVYRRRGQFMQFEPWLVKMIARDEVNPDDELLLAHGCKPRRVRDPLEARDGLSERAPRSALPNSMDPPF